MYAHLQQARHTVGRVDAPLHVIVVVFNPLRFQTRYGLFREFVNHAQAAGAKLHIIELAFGHRPFETHGDNYYNHWRIRTNQELWHKERMINAMASRLPDDWQYVAWVDADLTFVNPDWVQETIQQLQHFDVVQMFSHAIDVGPQLEPIAQFEGFAYSHVLGRSFPKLNGVKSQTRNGVPYRKPPSYYGSYGGGKYWHPGYGWAYTRDAWDALGGMLDVNVVGGGDHQMAYALIDRVDETIPTGSTPNYTKTIKQWGAGASTLKRNIGFVPGTVMHHWHGKKADRGYYNRWKILVNNKFDPLTDLRNDWQGMLMLSGDKPQLRDDLRAYFRARNEDATI